MANISQQGCLSWKQMLRMRFVIVQCALSSDSDQIRVLGQQFFGSVNYSQKTFGNYKVARCTYQITPGRVTQKNWIEKRQVNLFAFSWRLNNESNYCPKKYTFGNLQYGGQSQMYLAICDAFCNLRWSRQWGGMGIGQTLYSGHWSQPVSPSRATKPLQMEPPTIHKHRQNVGWIEGSIWVQEERQNVKKRSCLVGVHSITPWATKPLQITSYNSDTHAFLKCVAFSSLSS